MTKCFYKFWKKFNSASKVCLLHKRKFAHKLTLGSLESYLQIVGLNGNGDGKFVEKIILFVVPRKKESRFMVLTA